MNFNVLREYGAGETPQALSSPRKLPRHARGFAERLERKSTAQLTEAKIKKPLSRRIRVFNYSAAPFCFGSLTSLCGNSFVLERE
ncbi:hypothetical protein JOC76_002618 [Neobacillus cucumis]|nr:hypothetical protein [Neobacillus cucumis]